MKGYEYYKSLKKKDGTPSFIGIELNVISKGLKVNYIDQHPRDAGGRKVRHAPLDVSKFTKVNKDGAPIFNYYQMEAIYHGLAFDLDIELCSCLNKKGKPVYSHQEMERILSFIYWGKSTTDYLEKIKSEKEWLISELLLLSKQKREEFYLYENKEDTFSYPKFNHEQLKEILIGIRNNVDVTHYAHQNIGSRDMWEIRDALALGISPNILVIKGQLKLDTMQLAAVTRGHLAGINISIYAGNGESWAIYNYQQMNEILNGLLSGIDTSILTTLDKDNNPVHSAETMKQLRGVLESSKVNKENNDFLSKLVVVLALVTLILISN